jgi:hypothetical protein
MNRALLFDVIQGAGLALIGAGAWATWGAATAAIVTGALLIGITLLELHLLRRG